MNSPSRDYVLLMVVAFSAGRWPMSAFCQERMTLEGRTQIVPILAFSQDGKSNVGGGIAKGVDPGSSQLKVWDASRIRKCDQ